MPSTSEAQRRAMQAAAHGMSSIGIPQKVGKEFVKADQAKKKKSGQFTLRKEKRK
jgi:hypothetical protein